MMLTDQQIINVLLTADLMIIVYLILWVIFGD
jgi:hypothetical protein